MGQSGAEILSDIDRKTQNVRDNLARLNEKASQLLVEIEQERQVEAQLYLQLVQVNISQSGAGSLPALLSEAEREAFRLFKKRDELLARLDQQARAIQNSLHRLEEDRAAKTHGLETARLALAELRQAILPDLNNQPEFKEINRAIRQISEQIERVEQKIPVIQQDYQQKILAYHADPLFQHLWKVEYGTSGYRRQRLYRLLDQWVARLCRYEPARRNYAVLSALPQKFEQHKQLLIDNRAHQVTVKNSYIDKAVMAAGGQAHHDRIEVVQAEIQALDTDIAQCEAEYKAVLNEKSLVVSGQHAASQAATAVLERFFKNKTLMQLKIDATASPTPEDDEIIRNLYSTQERIRANEVRVSEYRDLILMEEKRLADIESVRRTYKDHHYDRDVRKHDGQTFSVLLGQVLSGILTSHVFWRIVAKLLDEVFDIDDVFEKKDRRYKRSDNRRRYDDDDD